MINQPSALSRFQKKLSWQDVELSKVFPLLKISASEDIDDKGDITSKISQVKDSGRTLSIEEKWYWYKLHSFFDGFYPRYPKKPKK